MSRADLPSVGIPLTDNTLLGKLAGGQTKPLSVAEVAGLLSAPSASTIGNLLTANQASAETDTSGWSVGSHTLTRDASRAWNGSASFKITATSVATLNPYTWSYYPAVVAGQVYTFRVMVCQPVGTRTGLVLSINWMNSGGGVISTLNSQSFALAANSSTFVEYVLTGVAPAGSATAQVSLYSTVAGGGAIGDQINWDGAGFWVGAGGQWAMPGVPIANTGRRVTHPNTDDVLVEVWDSTQGRWQRSKYDSGWRSVSTLLNGWAGSFNIRRIDDQVYFFVPSSSTLSGSAASAQRFWAMATGFKKGMNGGNDYIPMSRFNESATALLLANDFHLGGGTSYSSTTYAGCRATYEAEAAIPTSLPGTLVSSAPYA